MVHRTVQAMSRTVRDLGVDVINVLFLDLDLLLKKGIHWLPSNIGSERVILLLALALLETLLLIMVNLFTLMAILCVLIVMVILALMAKSVLLFLDTRHDVLAAWFKRDQDTLGLGLNPRLFLKPVYFL
jgi:hypothetical protein